VPAGLGEGNWTWDFFLAFAWQGPGGERLLVTVNYAPNQSQCYLWLPFPDLDGHQWRLEDLLGPANYDRDGNDLQSRGLYLDMLPWQAHVFSETGIAIVLDWLPVAFFSRVLGSRAP
jgi:hypothetical protein